VSSQRAHSGGDLAEILQRAVAARILSAEQAQAVLTAGRVRGGISSAGRRLSVTEALGYLGGLLTVSGAVTLVLQYWREVPTGGRFGLLAVVAAATWLVGARIGDGSAPALIRLRGALWLASSAGVAALASQIAWDVAHAGESAVWLSAGLAAAVHAASLLGTAGAVGLAVAAVGTLWVTAGWLRFLRGRPSRRHTRSAT
jgi:hypothetical protein